MKITTKSVFRTLWKTIALAVVFLFFVVTLFYINSTVYNFPEERPFSGNSIFNPYENLPSESYRANFHAHSIAWEKVTNGHNTEKDIFDEYTERGYDIVGISNYHKISAYAKGRTELYIPEYEHGYNIFKSHYLSINPNAVSYFDYPLFQSSSHQQKIIENLKAKNATVAMAHPKFGGGRSFSNMRKLVNYEFTEVLNHYRRSDEYWDAALSSGRLTWVMGNDDTHDLVKEPTFRIWNIIHSDTRNSDSILGDMKRGHNYAIVSENGVCDNNLSKCMLSDSNTIRVEFDQLADRIEFIGQNGELRSEVRNSKVASYSFSQGDTYIRIVAINANSSVYLNPIVRFNGKDIPLNTNLKAEFNFIQTWLLRLLFMLMAFGLFLLMRKVIRA